MFPYWHFCNWVIRFYTWSTYCIYFALNYSLHQMPFLLMLNMFRVYSTNFQECSTSLCALSCRTSILPYLAKSIFKTICLKKCEFEVQKASSRTNWAPQALLLPFYGTAESASRPLMSAHNTEILGRNCRRVAAAPGYGGGEWQLHRDMGWESSSCTGIWGRRVAAAPGYGGG